MRVIFINHIPAHPKVLNLGLTYMMTAVGMRHDVLLLDITFNQFNFTDIIRNVVDREEPDIFCFSVHSYSIKEALFWARVCKKLAPKVKIIFGGIHPTLMPEETINLTEVDCICIGEGEESFLNFLDLLSIKNYYPVSGIWYKDNKGEIIKSTSRVFVKELDKLPFLNWDFWDMERYLSCNVYKTINILASRGCIYDCSFCSAQAIKNAIPGEYYRCRNPQKVVDEIEFQLKRYKQFGLRNFAFCDSCFGLNKKQLITFSDEIKKRNLKDRIRWVCQTRVDVLDWQWIRASKDSGCVCVQLGVESADEEIRKQICGKKNIPNKSIIKAIGLLKAEKIMVILFFIVCTPNETFKTLIKNFIFIFKARAHKNHFFYFASLPKTLLGEKIINNFERMRNISDKSYKFTIFNHIYQHPLLAVTYLISDIIQRTLFFVFWILSGCYKKMGMRLNEHFLFKQALDYLKNI